jgi:hypothetical protein
VDKNHSLDNFSSAASSNPSTVAMAGEHIPHRELKQIQVQILAG